MSEEIAHFFEYKTNVKRRWIGKGILEVLVTEFRTRSLSYYTEAIEKGVVTLNGKHTSTKCILKEGDTIFHTVHMHEPVPPEVQVIADMDDYVVVNKPSGIPVHPTGGYYHFTVTRSLFPDKKVGCINRLDLPVSGVLLLVLQNHAKIHALIDSAKKYYVAKVRGVFPDSIIVDKAISSNDGHVRFIDDKGGRPSKTIFRKIAQLEDFSLVECQPITGRTHQIRVHLMHLGFPIVNDVLYGGYTVTSDNNLPDKKCSVNISEFEDQEKYVCIRKHCKGANNKSFKTKDSYICLHAWKYEFGGHVFEASWPFWARI